MSYDSEWARVSRDAPCPVCGHDHNCTILNTGDGKLLVYCGRVADGATRTNGGGQHLHVLNPDGSPWAWTPKGDDDDRFRNIPPATIAMPGQDAPGHPQPRPQPKPKKRTSAEWMRLALLYYSHGMDARKELAGYFGVPVSVLESLGVGFQPTESPEHEFWTFPELNPRGDVVGISRRYRSGAKRQITGGQRGLVYADDWLDADPGGPILLVEGASDVAAALGAGYCVVGRPSNVGGVAMLSTLLQHRDCWRRPIVVMGEHDRREIEGHDLQCEGCAMCWPGLHGAKTTAQALVDNLEREIGYELPPMPHKDVRAFLSAEGGVTNA